MKKLSLLIALALIVTIGGVYAAWNYGQGPTASLEITREINMAQVNTSSNKGTISADPTNVSFLVDDKGGFVAELNGTGFFAITFTAADGADQTVKDNGIKMQATVTLKSENNLKYNGTVTPITVNASSNVIDITNGVAAKTATLNVSDIVNALVLADVTLTTKAENDAFHTALKDYTIVITISEVA